MNAILEWQDGEANWLPMRTAPFYFFPEFAAPGGAFDAAIVRLFDYCKDGFYGPAGISVLAREGFVSIERGCARLEIDAVDGVFVMREPFQLVDEPAAFLESTSNFIERDEYNNEDVYCLYDMAADAWRKLQRNFEIAVREGHAQIVGRWHNVGAPFRPVYPDQWQHLRRYLSYTDEDEFGRPIAPVLRSPDGETVFSVQVRPIQKEVSATAKAENECVQWMVLLRRGPQAVQSRSALWEEAQRRWPGTLSNNGFDRACARARTLQPNDKWDRPGPRPRPK